MSQVGVGVYLAHGGVRGGGLPVRGFVGDMMDDETRVIMLESELAKVRNELTVAYMLGYEAGKKEHALNSYIPYATVREILKVLRHGDSKHPGEEWKTVSPHVHMLAAEVHIDQLSIEGRDREEESGCYHLAHAIVRYMFALAQYMGEVPMVHKEEV